MCQRVLTFGDIEITKRKSTILNTHLICTMLPYNVSFGNICFKYFNTAKNEHIYKKGWWD